VAQPVEGVLPHRPSPSIEPEPSPQFSSARRPKTHNRLADKLEQNKRDPTRCRKTLATKQNRSDPLSTVTRCKPLTARAPIEAAFYGLEKNHCDTTNLKPVY